MILDTTAPDAKQIRMSEWTKTIEDELQQRLVKASELRQIINTSKTSTKREYYTKKFAKVNKEVYRMVAMLQKLTPPSDVQTLPQLTPPADDPTTIPTV